MTDNERKRDEDLQRAAEEFFAAKVSEGYTPEHATAMLHQRFHQVSCTRFRRHRVRCFMEQEVCHGETAVYPRVQARGGSADQRARRVVCAGVRRRWCSPDAVARLGEAACGRPAACVPWPGSDEA